jgi:hypothetical protein
MRTLLRWVTNRYGVVGILVLGVLVVVGVGRLAGGEADRPGSAAPGEDPYATVSFGPDDGVWADHDVAAGTWRERLRRYATASLMERLAVTDPVSVPTDRITGKPKLTSVTGRSHAGVTVEAKGGLLVLGLRYADHHWAVDSIDWRRG